MKTGLRSAQDSEGQTIAGLRDREREREREVLLWGRGRVYSWGEQMSTDARLTKEEGYVHGVDGNFKVFDDLQVRRYGLGLRGSVTIAKNLPLHHMRYTDL